MLPDTCNPLMHVYPNVRIPPIPQFPHSTSTRISAFHAYPNSRNPRIPEVSIPCIPKRLHSMYTRAFAFHLYPNAHIPCIPECPHSMHTRLFNTAFSSVRNCTLGLSKSLVIHKSLVHKQAALLKAELRVRETRPEVYPHTGIPGFIASIDIYILSIRPGQGYRHLHDISRECNATVKFTESTSPHKGYHQHRYAYVTTWQNQALEVGVQLSEYSCLKGGRRWV